MATIDGMRQRVLGRTGLRVSELALGTVELGLDYGIRVPGKELRPAETAASILLNQALDLGVTLIDTARAYGSSEEIIGKAIGHRRGEFVLVSKTKSYRGEFDSPGDRAGAIRRSVEESLRLLRTGHLDLLLLHSSTLEEVIDPICLEVLARLREDGLTRFIGASVYGCAAAKAALQTSAYSCLQVAWNLLDRSVEQDVLPVAVESGVGLMARSVLMRGALTSRHEHLPPALAPVSGAARHLESIARSAGISLPELAFRYILSHPGPLAALVGTAWSAELAQAVEYAGHGPLSADLLEAIRQVQISDPQLLDLSRWPPV